MMNKIFYLNEDGNDDMRNALDGSIQGKVHTFNKALMEYLLMYYRRFVFLINLQSDLFANIQFPTLPDNFLMLMSEIDFPEKAKVNINNSLFMKPQQIDLTSAEDIGLQQFNSSKFKNMTGMKMTLAPQAYSRQMESIVYALDKIALRQLFEDTASGSGVSMSPEDIKAHNAAMTELNTNVVNAIDNYIDKSKDAVKSLLEMVGGSNAKEALKSIQTASEASDKTVGDWLDSVSAIRKESSESMRMGQLSALKNIAKYTKNSFALLACINKSNIPGKTSKDEYYNKVSEEALSILDKTDMDHVIATYTMFKKYDEFLKYYKQKLGGKPGPIPLRPIDENNNTNTSESYHFSTIETFKVLNESGYDEYEDNEAGASKDEPLDYDKIYQDLFHYLSRAMNNAIGERDNWLCFKDVRQNMDYLVKGADEEITKKIELVSKTGGQKSLVHWPFKAEGLKGIWKRYMSELQLRVNNRIDLLTGSHGGVTTGSANMVELFLTVTYPQIIAMMITYKCVFLLLKDMYSRDLMAYYTFEDCPEIIKEFENQFTDLVRIFLGAWHHRDKS